MSGNGTVPYTLLVSDSSRRYVLVVSWTAASQLLLIT